MDRPDDFGGMPPPPASEPTVPQAPPEPPAGRDLVNATVAGVLAAIVGGIVWGLIVDATDAEWGFVAIGIGILTGFAVVLASRGTRGVPLQVIAAATAVLGILWGKYFAFVQVGRGVLEELGAGADVTLPLFSGDTFSLFTDAFGEIFSGFDLAWIAFAVYTAWRIPQGRGFGSRLGRRSAE